jgi:HK97 family phage portal protein
MKLKDIALSRLDRFMEKRGYAKAETIVGAVIGSYLTNMVGSVSLSEKKYSQLVDAYRSWVYTCIDKIAKAVAVIPLRLFIYRRSGRKVVDLSWLAHYKSVDHEEKRYILKNLSLEREEIFGHPFLDLMRRPNHLMTRFMLWYETLIRLELAGYCGWYLPTNRIGLPMEIWPLPLTKNANLTPKVNSDLTLQYWEYKDGEINRRFDPKDVLFMRYPHPASPFQGMSPLMAQLYPYDIDLFLMQQQRGLFANSAIPGLHLSTDQKLVKEQIDELKAIIDAQYVSPGKAGTTLITHSGLKADSIAMTGRELMIDKVSKFAREKLITSYDLSEGKLGMVADVNRANMEALDKTFVMECLKPKCMLIEEMIECFCLPRYTDGLTCDFDLPDMDDKEFTLKELESNLTTGLHTINEERARRGEQPVDWGDRPWLPFGVTQPRVGGSLPEPPSKSAVVHKGLTPEFWTEDKKVITWKRFVQDVDRYKDLIGDPMKDHFHKQKEQVIRRLFEEGKKINGLYAGWSRTKIEQHVAKSRTTDKINIDKVDEAKKLASLLSPIVKLILSLAGTARIEHLGSMMKAKVRYNVNDPKVKKWLGARMEQFSKEVAGTSFDEIEAILRVGFTEGLPVSTIADNLSEKFASWEEYRAPLIARTETISAINFADVDSLEQTGMDKVLNKFWLSARDGNCRDTHAEADKRYAGGIPVDEMFEVGGDEMIAPGNGSDASENINCRCCLGYVEK